MMMRNINKIGLLTLLVVFLSCNNTMDDYFRVDTEETSDMTVLEVLDTKPEYSTFVSIFRSYSMDTIFDAGKSITIFVPDNDAFASTYDIFLDTLDAIRYYVSETYINLAQIQGEVLVKTVGDKYATISNTGAQVLYDDAVVIDESPLCVDGKYYGISNFVQPKPNLYEYISATNEFYKAYIDAQDSRRLDPNSTPIGYEDGNTVYDTIWIEENFFEIDYFPVSEELKEERATLFLFTGEQMKDALEVVSDDLGLASVEDIPEVWINEIMMPALTDNSVFARELQPEDFASGRVKNIKGDSVDVNFDDINNESFQCSNGLAYQYEVFSIPEELYYGTDTIHGESLTVEKGIDSYTWGPNVITEGTPYVPDPMVEFNQKLGKNIMSVSLSESTSFEMTTSFNNMFPGSYLLICNVKTNPSGVFKIYANDKLLEVKIIKGFAYGGTITENYIDLYDIRNQGSSSSPNTIRYISDTRYSIEEGFRTFEVLVEDIEEYGDVDIRIVYEGPSPKNSRNKGFILNYMTLESWNE